ncbi:hypothetical protein TRFO_14572 [Tritrichomonas foetus]|uniref:Viral A-type inclusion protein n=1 Tax=Tritrichomonas foetus TaxID=1144522 RepID=A0A1J4KVM0_9EUKA|nr:hypothetical protein TRFO_14572 [Tritrichomonas foetus]|eukprot:OHT14936.1 hypothetical protein TRFO_14572 [Tritrichomonas foetus]
MSGSDTERTIQALNSLTNDNSFVSLVSFLQQFDLQNQDLQLGQPDYDSLRQKINDFKDVAYSTQLDLSNPLMGIIHILVSAYTLQINQIEILNEQLNNENDNLRTELGNQDQIKASENEKFEQENMANQEKFNENETAIEGLNSQINQLKLALSNAEAQNENSRSEGRVETVLAVANEFGLTSREQKTLISGLKAMIEEPQGVIKNIVQSFDLPPTTTSKDIIFHLNEKFTNSGSSVLVEQLREELLKKTEENEALKDQLNSNDKGENKGEIENSNNSDKNVIEPPVTATLSDHDRNKITNLEKQVAELQQIISQTPTEKQILSIFEDVPLETDEISNIVSSDQPLLEKLNQIVSTLSLHVFSGEDLHENNKMLLGLVSSQFRFIKMLADSEKACTAVYTEVPYEEMRHILLGQTEAISLFLQEHAAGIVEDSCLFEELLKSNTPDLLENVQKYLSSYTKPTSRESEQLFILLLQAISASDVLRKYSEQSQTLCRQQANDIKQMKNYSEQLEKSIETFNNSNMLSTPERSIPGTPKSGTLKSIANTPTSNEQLSPEKGSQGQLSSEKDQGTGSEYVKNLQKQLAKVRAENIELKKGKEQLIKQTHDDLLTVQQQIDKMKDSMSKRLTNKNKDIMKLSAALKNTTERVKELRSINDNLKKQLKEKETPKEKIDDNSKSLINDIQEQFEETKREYESALEQMRSQISSYQESKQDEFNSVVSEKDRKINDLTYKLEESVRNSKKLAKRSYSLSQQLESAQAKIDELSRSENEALTQAEQLGIKFREIHDDYTKLEHEKEMLAQKIESNNDVVKRDKQLLETQYEHKLNDQQLQYQASLSKIKEDSDAEGKKLLLDIAHIFPSFVDLNQPVTRASILDALQNVKKAADSERKLKKKREILEQARKDLKVEHDIQIPGSIITLMNKFEQLQNEAKPLADGMEVYVQTQDWLTRMYVLCTGGICQDVNNIEMQHVIEEALVTSFGSLLLSRRVAMLRAQKRLLMKGVDKIEKKNTRLSIRHILINVMLILKARKLSGHRDNTGYSFENAERPEDILNKRAKKPLTFAEKAPLSNFIYDVE